MLHTAATLPLETVRTAATEKVAGWAPEPKRKHFIPVRSLTTIPHLIEVFNFHFSPLTPNDL
jgi:hypothetical protein